MYLLLEPCISFTDPPCIQHPRPMRVVGPVQCGDVLVPSGETGTSTGSGTTSTSNRSNSSITGTTRSSSALPLLQMTGSAAFHVRCERRRGPSPATRVIVHWSPGRGGRRLAAYSGRGPAKHGLCWRDERRGIGLARGCAPDTQMPAERSATLEPWIILL